nr:DUF2779 domain-containing protein [Metamycoplasma arthritidis]
MLNNLNENVDLLNLEEASQESKDLDYDEINFEFENIEKLLNDTFLKKYLNNEEIQKIEANSLSTKISYLENKITSNANFVNTLKQEGQLQDFWSLKDAFRSVEVFATGIESVFEKATEHVCDEFANKYPHYRNKIKILSKKDSAESLIKTTKNAIDEGHKLIINPVFEYRNAIARPFYYNAEEKTLAWVVPSSKTNKKNLLRAYYDFKVVEKNVFRIENCFLYSQLYKKRENQRKGIIDFYKSEYCNISKSKPSIKDYTSETEIRKRLAGEIVAKGKNAIKIINHIYGELGSISSEKHFYSFDKFILIINNLSKYPDFFSLNVACMQEDFGPTFDVTSIVYPQIISSRFPHLTYASKALASELIFNKQNAWVNSFFTKNLIKIYPTLKNAAIDIIRFFDESKQNFVWFDFEGFTMPEPIMNYHSPWTQLVSQLSIIKTKDNKIYQSDDFVYDPQKYSYQSLIKIVNDIYDQDADGYVVFNKGYEKTRLLEIKEMLFYYAKDKIITEELYFDISHKVDAIIDKIIDLLCFFAVRSLNSVKETFILISKLMCRYSIKMVERFITENNIELEHKIIPYHELEVKNGSIALAIANARANNAIKDNEWAQKVVELKKYCHNDVIAMIMAGDLIRMLWEHKDEYNKEVETNMFI